MDYIQRMRNLREDSDKTQQQIADYLGTSQTMYARYERGANELPIHHLLALCKYYNVSADYILGLSNIKQIPNKTSESNPLRFTHGCFFIKKITYFRKKLFIFIK